MGKYKGFKGSGMNQESRKPQNGFARNVTCDECGKDILNINPRKIESVVGQRTLFIEFFTCENCKALYVCDVNTEETLKMFEDLKKARVRMENARRVCIRAKLPTTKMVEEEKASVQAYEVVSTRFVKKKLQVFETFNDRNFILDGEKQKLELDMLIKVYTNKVASMQK